ncbi:MAG TPA: VOC family protein [Dehalococcoidales bacterium]|nr:MAG: lactoylglutathione lyase [Chloroflexi bacterium RBG_16_60_22]HJX12332.1 VOC family protein [Dehalococcoidales bacterium]
MFKRVDHVEIIPGDAGECTRFFTDIMGFRLKEHIKIDRPPMKGVIFVELNGTVIEIIDVANPAPPSAEPWQVSYKRIAIEVEDMDKAIDFLRSKGVKIIVPPMALADSKRAEIAGPDGLSIELREWFSA